MRTLPRSCRLAFAQVEGLATTYRPAAPGDVSLLRHMLWHAINWRNEDVSPHDWPDRTAPARYVCGFGRCGDAGVVAEVSGRGVGAAWYRLLPADDPGYGFVSADVPEVSLGVAPIARGRRIGTTLMLRLLDTAVASRVRALSLSVEPDNHAMRLYEQLGFTPVGTSGGSVTLLRNLAVV
jgi:ribosomal protein S18 acetylase RimI-like enzyme